MGKRGYALLTDDLGQAPERIPCWNLPHTVRVDDRVETVSIGERAFGVEAEEGVAAEPLGRLCALQQEYRVLLREPEDGRDRRLEVPYELGVERHNIVGTGESAGLAERRDQAEASRGGHAVPSLRPLSPRPAPRVALAGGRRGRPPPPTASHRRARQPRPPPPPPPPSGPTDPFRPGSGMLCMSLRASPCAAALSYLPAARPSSRKGLPYRLRPRLFPLPGW